MTTTERNLERMISRARDVMGDLEDTLRDLPDEVTGEAKKIRRRLVSSLRDAGETCRRLEKRAVAGLHATDEAIHRKPYPFLGAAVGVGLLVGLVLFSRR